MTEVVHPIDVERIWLHEPGDRRWRRRNGGEIADAIRTRGKE